MKIGWSDYGLWSVKQDQASGMWNWTLNAWNMLKSMGHEVFFLQDPIGYDGSVPVTDIVNLDFATKSGGPLPTKLDVVFMAHRWKVPAHEDRWDAVYRQEEILSKFHGTAKIVVHDEDLTVDADFETHWPDVIIAEPSIYPVKITRDRYRLYFPMFANRRDWTLPNESWKRTKNILGYVGNNYNRLDMAAKYFLPASVIWKTNFYGNWMVESPERPSPKIVAEALPGVNFFDRLPQSKLPEVFRSTLATVHIAPKSYCERGFITGRWAEAAKYGIIAFIPEEFNGGKKVFGNFEIVNNGYDVASQIGFILLNELESRGYATAIVEKQRKQIFDLKIFDAENWARRLLEANEK